MIGIYKITNPIGDVYIGKSKNIRTRYFSHRNPQATKNNLYLSYEKYGFENHLFNLINICKIEDLDKNEYYFVNKYRPKLNNYQLKNKNYTYEIKPIEVNFLLYLTNKSECIYNLMCKDENGMSILINQLQSQVLQKCADESLKSK